MKKYVVKLIPKERKRLLAIVNKGKNKASVIRDAHILLKSDEGQTDQSIAKKLYISEDTVSRTRQRFCEEGIVAALTDKPHPGREPKLDAKPEAYLVALACSDPPAGQAKWTMELLARRLVADGLVDRIAPDTVRLVLKKTNSSPGK